MSKNKVETVDQGGDKIKLTLAVLVVLAGIFSYSYFSDLNVYARLGIFIGSLALAVLFVWISPSGKRLLGFSTASYNELKRVVWPNRKETIQMTAIVFAFVAVMSIFLWIVDKMLEWILYGGILGW